ncbi:MAG: MoaD/ThiS family protein [Acidobacteria bacterium]|nr:MoaD/ThiS family protein [Acidobacteriota bacterium]
MTCVVELFGVARMLAGCRDVPITVPDGATLADVWSALSRQVPMLAGRVIASNGAGLADGYACNVNGLDFVRNSAASINPGDRVLIVSADAGG